MTIQGITLPKKIQLPQQDQGQQGALHKQRQEQSLFQNPDNGQTLTKNEALVSFHGKIEKQNQRVIAHEEAHKSASGPQASGSPQYHTKSVGFGGQNFNVITGGYQMINVPGMVSEKASKSKIQETITAAEYTIRGAEAPAAFDELSAADRSVAAKGRAVLSFAKSMLSKKTDNQQNIAKAPDQQGQDKKGAEIGKKINLMG